MTPRNVIPLPTTLPDFTKARPPECEFERDAQVLALYPQTTCFYVGKVVQTPSKVRLPAPARAVPRYVRLNPRPRCPRTLRSARCIWTT